MKIFYLNRNEITITETDGGTYRCNLTGLRDIVDLVDSIEKLVFANSVTRLTIQNLLRDFESWGFKSTAATEYQNPRVFKLSKKYGEDDPK